MSEARFPVLSAAQDLLLRTVLSDGEEAIAYWTAWRKMIAVEDLDFASQRLLPLLLDKLERLNVSHPDLGKYKSVARYTWLKNKVLVRLMHGILKSLSAVKIPAMPFEDLAIAALYYNGDRLRTMSGIDILVPDTAVADAVRLVCQNGWRPASASLLVSAGYRRTNDVMYITNDQNEKFNLHWHVVRECCWPRVDEVFWLHSQNLIIGDIETRALSDTDHLFCACARGGLPNIAVPVHWIVDSAQILRSRSIDWARFVQQASDFDLVTRTQRAIHYLHKTFALPIPNAAIEELQTLRPSRVERLEQRSTASRLPPLAASAISRYVHYRRNRVGGEGFLHYLGDLYGTQSLATTIRSAARRTVARLFGR
jgi:Uncharacterised nucleotidyltransferase